MFELDYFTKRIFLKGLEGYVFSGVIPEEAKSTLIAAARAYPSLRFAYLSRDFEEMEGIDYMNPSMNPAPVCNTSDEQYVFFADGDLDSVIEAVREEREPLNVFEYILTRDGWWMAVWQEGSAPLADIPERGYDPVLDGAMHKGLSEEIRLYTTLELDTPLSEAEISDCARSMIEDIGGEPIWEAVHDFIENYLKQNG
jgi:hypothetical protein